MLSLKDTVALYERALIQEALRTHQFNAKEAANALGTEYQAFRNKMKRHGLTRKQLRLSRDREISSVD